jgi:hypothetical protein
MGWRCKGTWDKTKPLGKSKQGLWTGNKPREDSNVKTLEKWRKKKQKWKWIEER